ncbi:MAG: NAD(P)-dependent oxidoreductase [Actinomycetes bacterium]
MPKNSQTIWCQWPDLIIPEGFKLISKPTDSLSEAELSEITFYVPGYMAGVPSLACIPKMPNVKFVQLLTAGFDDVIEHLHPGLALYNAQGVHDYSTAELALALMLAKLRFIPEYVKNQAAGKWEHSTTGSLADKTVAIVGYGSIGKTFENLIANFPIKIIRFAQSERENVFPIAKINDYLPTIDVVVLIVPLTDLTRNLFNKEKFSLMKQGSLIINVARGGVINTDDLLEALRAGRIHAALDVTDPEPLPMSHPLWFEKNVLIVPHVGGDSSSFEPRARKLVTEQLERISHNQPMVNEIGWEK